MTVMPRSPAKPSLLLIAIACFLNSGCGADGPKTFEVSGTVTFDGKPVPAGRVDFFPDFATGNDGPQGFATIKDGAFDTRKGGQGHAGGAIVIRIEGFDGKSDNPKFPGTPIFVTHQINRELPKEASVQNLEVPASAATDLVVLPKSKS